jgi:hypothetical protein
MSCHDSLWVFLNRRTVMQDYSLRSIKRGERQDLICRYAQWLRRKKSYSYRVLAIWKRPNTDISRFHFFWLTCFSSHVKGFYCLTSNLIFTATASKRRCVEQLCKWINYWWWQCTWRQQPPFNKSHQTRKNWADTCRWRKMYNFCGLPDFLPGLR